MDGLLGGFSALMSPDLWALMLVGVVVGIIFGAIPGLSATMAIVLFLPITFSLNVYQAFTLLVALYIGGVSGGLISAMPRSRRCAPETSASAKRWTSTWTWRGCG